MCIALPPCIDQIGRRGSAASPSSEWKRSQPRRKARSARQLHGDASAVQPEVLPGDSAISELEDVQDAEPDLLAISGNPEKLSRDSSGHQVFDNCGVVGVVGVQVFFAVGANLVDKLPEKLKTPR